MSARHGITFEPGGDWAAELAELQARRASALAMGGPEALARFKASGRMNARERIAVPYRHTAERPRIALPR